jgi:TRAP-type transport system periplasmic protein
MFRKYAITAVCVALSFLAMPADGQVVLKLTSPTINDAPHEWMKVFSQRLEARAPGKFKPEIYPAGQLGPFPRMIEGLQLGTVEFYMLPGEFLVGVDKRFGVLGAPMMLDDLDHGYRAVHHADFREKFWKLGEPKGIMVVSDLCDTDTSFAFRIPIHSLDEFNGKKLRVFPSAMERESVRRLGAAAAPMPLEEVTTAITQGTIDGIKSGISGLMGLKAYTVAKYLVRTGESFVCSMRFMSKPWFDKLPAELQKVVLEEALDTDKTIHEFGVNLWRRLYAEWKQGGGELKELTPVERADLKRRIGTVGEDVANADPDLREYYGIWKRIADATRKQ